MKASEAHTTFTLDASSFNHESHEGDFATVDGHARDVEMDYDYSSEDEPISETEIYNKLTKKRTGAIWIVAALVLLVIGGALIFVRTVFGEHIEEKAVSKPVWTFPAPANTDAESAKAASCCSKKCALTSAVATAAAGGAALLGYGVWAVCATSGKKGMEETDPKEPAADLSQDDHLSDADLEKIREAGAFDGPVKFGRFEAPTNFRHRDLKLPD